MLVRVGIFEAEGYMLVRIISTYIEKVLFAPERCPTARRRRHCGGMRDVPGVNFWDHLSGRHFSSILNNPLCPIRYDSVTMAVDGKHEQTTHIGSLETYMV